MNPTLTQIRRETGRRLRRLDAQTGDDVRRMRLDANVSVAALSRATGIDAAYLGRIESGRSHPSNEVLIAIGVALGADLSIRFFPGTGPRIHDRFQAPMIEALIRALDPRWHVELEVPVTRPSRGVIDAVFHDSSGQVVVATEVHSDLRRLEQQIRWSREKADGLAAKLAESAGEPMVAQVSRLLVLRSTVRLRELARQFEATLEATYPARTVDVIAALTMPDAPWPGASIAWIHLHGSEATLMGLPPPGVGLGR